MKLTWRAVWLSEFASSIANMLENDFDVKGPKFGYLSHLTILLEMFSLYPNYREATLKDWYDRFDFLFTHVRASQRDYIFYSLFNYLFGYS